MSNLCIILLCVCVLQWKQQEQDQVLQFDILFCVKICRPETNIWLVNKRDLLCLRTGKEKDCFVRTIEKHRKRLQIQESKSASIQDYKYQVA